MTTYGSIPRGPLPPEVKLDENVYVPVRDGIKLALDIYRPRMEGRYPALFSMSPYIKEMQQWSPILSHSIEAGDTPYFVSRGYVHVIATSRGSGYSQGEFNWYDIKEQQDGYDLIEWIARQPWCNGNVGMIGDSYFARIQYLTAAQQPPHLKCLVPFDGGSDDYRDSRYHGGMPFSSFLGGWGFDTMRQCLWPGPVEGKLPPTNIFYNFATHPEDGPYYWERSAWPKIESIKAPMLAIAVAGSFVHSRGQLAAYPRFQAPKKLMVAPPTGPRANVFFIQSRPLNEYIMRWLDHWLKGIDTGIMNEPEVIVYDAGRQQWRYENEYPLARTGWSQFYFHSNPAGPATAPPYGLISIQAPGKEGPDKYVTPDCIRQLAAGKPVLAYSSAPMDKDLTVWGPLAAVIYGATSAMDTAWFVKVGDIGPEGNLTMLSQGHLKASFRQVDPSKSKPGQPYHPFTNPVRPEQNRVHEYQIEMLPVFHTFRRGHRIWVQIASDDFVFQGNLHTIYNAEMLPLPAENVVYHDGEHPSHILLPVIPDAPVIKPVAPPVSEIRWPL